MRKLLVGIISLLCVVSAYALPIECVGTVAQVENNGDTLFIFASTPHIKSNVGNLTWYKVADNSVCASGTADIYPDGDGTGIYVMIEGTRKEFYVFDYAHYKPVITDLQITPYCQSSILNITGTLPEMTYVNAYGQTQSYARQATVVYNDLAWDGEAWQDSVASTIVPLRQGDIAFAAFYAPTSFTLTIDEPFYHQLGLSPITVTSAQINPKAVKANLTTQTTIRGSEGEKSNELERPTDATVLSGSAPLEILFKANPTPAVEYYYWQIYKGSTLIGQRREEEQRYTFTEPGSYNVVCMVNNTFCPCTDDTDPECKVDSFSVIVKVSKSHLRVPNVFTPNGDGANDEFRVEYRSLKEFHIWVYNRWGKLVYESTDPSKGWDGTINGLPAAEGAYFYVIRAMGTDAGMDDYTSKISYNKKKNKSDESIIGVYQMSGDINLIRGNKQ